LEERRFAGRPFGGPLGTGEEIEDAAAGEFNFTPELHLIDGRIIRNIEDAILFVREHEARPGVDRRDEVMHALERARTREEGFGAAQLFIGWLEELGILAWPRFSCLQDVGTVTGGPSLA